MELRLITNILVQFVRFNFRWGFRVAHNTISLIIRETCKAIIEILGPIYLKPPKSGREWRAVSYQFENKWNFKGELKFFENFSRIRDFSEALIVELIIKSFGASKL